MKILLVQLPVPNNLISNLPLPLGYLKATADRANLPGVEVQILERAAQNRGGDAYLLDKILAYAPDLVGFSLYTWNSSRVLELARALKKAAPEILLLGGGPEVNRDSDFILTEPAFDFLAFGEGERTFLELLNHFATGKPELPAIKGLGWRGKKAGLVINPPRGAIEDVNLVPSAYLDGTLDGYLDKFISIELSRWCPSRCSFCYYGRQDLPLGSKRYFDLARVRAELEYALARGIEQVHFVEANFNTLPHLDKLYRTIIDSGANRQLKFYAEMRGEAIDVAEAERLAECNFGTVEVGLQSAVPEVLAKVRRKNHLPRLVQGIKNLRERGIEVFLDAILGLPGDTPDTFRRTLEFIEQNGLEPYDMFHLQILSGTQLKTEALAGQHGLKWQNEPPYFVLETAELSFEQLVELRQETLRRKGDDPAQIQGLPQPGPFSLANIPPGKLLPGHPSEPLERLILDANYLPELAKLARLLASEVTLWLRNGSLEQYQQILAALSAPNPTGVWHIFAESDRPLHPSELQKLAPAIHHKTGYLDRLAVFALAEADPEKFPTPPSIQVYNLVNWRPELATEGNSQTIWQIREDPPEDWQARLLAAAEAPGGGILVNTNPELTLEKIRVALATLENSDKPIWVGDWAVAAGLAGDELPVKYLLTYTSEGTGRVDLAALAKAQLRWALAGRKFNLR